MARADAVDQNSMDKHARATSSALAVPAQGGADRPLAIAAQDVYQLTVYVVLPPQMVLVEQQKGLNALDLATAIAAGMPSIGAPSLTKLS